MRTFSAVCYFVESPPRAKRKDRVHAVVSYSNGSTVKGGLTLTEAQRLAGDLTDGCANDDQRQAWNLMEQGWSDAEIADEIEVVQKHVAEFRARREALTA